MSIAPLLATLLAVVSAAPGTDSASSSPSAFDDFAPASEFPSADLVHTLLRPVGGLSGEVSESNKLGRPAARFAGLLRYEETWPAGSVLRIAVVDVQSLQIHVWAGQRGVSLRFRPDAGRSGAQWAVYGTQRQGAAPRPDQSTIWATDEGRYRRTGEGTFELHWADGLLAMTRGDVVLWRVPLDGQPSEVFFDGTAIVRGLGIVRASSLPPAAADLPLLREVPRPADLQWREDLPPGVALTKLPDGAVELSAGERSKAGQVWASVVPAGLQEYIFELEDPQAGTGIYLGDEAGEPLVRVGFFHSRGRAGLTFGLVSGRNTELERSHPDTAAVPYAGARQWLRLVLAAGIARVWTSGDGRHWSQPPESTMRATGGCRSVGLYCIADQPAHALRLRHLQVRRLEALAALAPADLVEQIQTPTSRRTRGRSSGIRVSERPTNVSEDAWRRATTMRIAIDSPNSSVGQAALGQLVREAVDASKTVDEGLTLLGQAARITETTESGHGAAIAALYDLLGRRLVAQRDPAPYTRIRKAMLEAPLGGAPPSVPHAWASGQLLRHQLLAAAYEGRWDDLAQQCREALFWSRSRTSTSPPLPAWEQAAGPVIDWAAAQLEAHRRLEQAQQMANSPAKEAVPPTTSTAPLPARTPRGRGSRPVAPADTTHPLVDRLGKEAYNVAADLEAALAGGSFREACQIIRSAGDTAAGLVPGSDPQLLVTLQVSLEQAFAGHPELARAMEQNFGPLSDLRFKQAADAADAAAVEALADQFPGTNAARSAQQWLGDRALAAGQFPQAMSRYRRALAGAADAQPATIAARLRLVGAILGKSAGEPLSAPVELGDARLPAGEFEQLLATLRSGPVSAPPGSVTLPAPASGSIDIRSWASIAAGPEQRLWNARRPFDLAARQTTVSFTERMLLVTTPARMLAFNLSDGRALWVQSVQLEPERSSAASMLIEPVIVGARGYFRRPAGRGGQLACLDLTDGKSLWTSPADVAVISAPVPAGPCVFALLAAPGQSSQVAVHWAQFDAATGRLLGRWPVVDLRDQWQGAIRGTAAWADDTLIAAVGGCVVAADPAGRVRWVRRQLFLPPAVDNYPSSRMTRAHQAPRVVGGRVYVTQPGVCAVECLELSSGRLLWRRAEPDLLSLAGVDAGRAVLATANGLLAVDAASGRQLWTCEDLEPLETGVLVDRQAVLRAVLHRKPEGPPEVLLQWLDAGTGQVKASCPIAAAWDRRATLGPLAIGAGRVWAFLGRGDDPQRQLVELKLLP
jgi:outer membrane protein assembly factor BamB